MTTFRFCWTDTFNKLYKDIKAPTFREARREWFEIIKTHYTARIDVVWEMSESGEYVREVFTRESN